MQSSTAHPTVPHESLLPFASWPREGLPQGYFSDSKDPAIPEYYAEQGYCVLADAFSAEELDALRAETLRLARNVDGQVKGIDPAPGAMDDWEAQRRVLCIHFPHKISDVMLEGMKAPPVAEVLARIISPDVKAMQSMLFLKASGKPGQAWHQDEGFIPTRDRSLCGGWIALDDATVENGCLWVIPGSHKPGILWPREFHYDRRFDCTHETRGYSWTDADSIPVEVKAGSVVFFNGYLLHRSLPNRSERGFRRSLVNHYMSASSLLPWRLKEESNAVAMADYRDIVMVAGEDPYDWKGYEDIAHSFIRPDGEGGCVEWKNIKADEGQEPAGSGLSVAPDRGQMA